MFEADYKWHHDYVKLACDTSFKFEKHNPDNLDKSKIQLVDVDRVIDQKDIATVDKLIPTIIKFVLDSEQARILDEGFVKIFRLSQLAVQYLLYCKHYLDNTVVILKGDIKKLKEENQELNLFVDDLKEHVSTLMKEIGEKNAFKCQHCNKIFSTEEFLSSHIKRRHSTLLVEDNTDKLHVEIKELKGRLNDAEKMIQDDHVHYSETQLNTAKELELQKVDELQHKFEDLRFQVQSELKILQTQYSFQEKYEKLFEKMALQKSFQAPVGKGHSRDIGQRRESTTQTDINEEIESVTRLCNSSETNKENVPEFSNTQKQITDFGEALEMKVTSSLQKIENQMQSFWNKLHQMEIHKNKDSPDSPEVLEKPKPIVKPRSKFTVKNVPDSEIKPEETFSSPKRNISEVVVIHQPIVVVEETALSNDFKRNITKSQRSIAKLPQMVEAPDDDDTTSESVSSDSPEEESDKPPTPPIIPSVSKKPPLSRKNVFNGEFLDHFRDEVEKIVMGRLQDLGVSPDWRGLPNRSFERAMEIVNHQASLLRKTYPNFNVLAQQIEKDVSEKVKNNKSNNRKKQTVHKKSEKSDIYKVKSNERREMSLPVQIKNRRMYETDSESEIRPLENLKQIAVPYSAVIEELKMVTTKIENSDNSSNAPNAENVKNEDQAKGVLKNYPSVGSLTKKKVLFNLDLDNNINKDKDGGSTTSVASSVFDGTPRKDDTAQQKDIEDVSDFEFSEM